MSDVRVRLNDRQYEWGGTFWHVLTSRERGVREGDTRVIEETLFYARSVFASNWRGRKAVWWSLLGDYDPKRVEDFKAKVLK